MERRDYLLKEIEKIGTLLNALRQKLFGGDGNLSITVEKQIEDAKEMLLSEVNFDFGKFLENLDIEHSNEYISGFEGFSIENIERLAEYLSQAGFHDYGDHSGKYLEKALQLYELCNLKSKTYSFERERSIQTIKNVLQEKEVQ
ncbi:MAG: hypothetical protein LBE91_18910 [Tannerella sp.]|jgi:hypothetical protein|nr:hypothetical protein [Tannerella sp.]